MSKYIQVRPDLFLTSLPVKAQVKATARPAVSHVWVIDRSGSMWTEIRPLVEDIKKKVRTLPAGDLFTLGWFSSEGGRFGFPLKGYKIAKDEDFSQLDRLLDQYASTIALTCFSEVLNEVSNVVLELEPLARVFSFMLFTDGYPVVSNQAKEEAQIKASLEKISAVVSSAQLVGYGDFYNKTLMADMARWVGGTLQHSSSLERTSAILQDFVEAQTGYKRVEIELPYALDKVFLINGDRISQYEPHITEDGAYKVWVDQPEQDSLLYGVSSIRPAVGGKLSAGEDRLKGLYGAALVLNQAIQTDEAMAMLNLAEDPYLIDQLNNAYNNEEHGRAERLIERAIFDKTYRYQAGKKKDYLPADDAFCLADLMNLLMEDKAAKFYPYSKDFKYKRVGPPSTPKEGYPKFEPDKSGSYLADLVWNQDQLNLNILTRTKGHVNLGPDAKDYALDEQYETYIFRNYTLVRDGALWTERLPVSISNETYTQLVEKGVGLAYPTEPLDESEGYTTSIVINLASIPIINRQTAKAAAQTTAAQLAEWALEELKLGGELKVAKAFLEEIAPERPHTGSELTAVQQQFLESQGVGRNGFSPPSDRASAEDYYFAPTLSIKVKGFSALPTVNKIKEQVAAGKELKGPAAAMEATLHNLRVMQKIEEVKGSTSTKTVEVVEAMITNLKARQRLIRKHIQTVKFSIILGNQWFPNASSRDEVIETVDGIQVSIVRGQTKVHI